MRIGDRVRCIRGNGTVRNGQTYIVASVRQDDRGGVLYCTVVGSEGIDVFQDRFELVQEDDEEQLDFPAPPAEEVTVYLVTYRRGDGIVNTEMKTTTRQIENVIGDLTRLGWALLKKQKVVFSI